MAELSEGQKLARKYASSDPHGLVWQEAHGYGENRKVYLKSLGFRSYVRLNQFLVGLATNENLVKLVEGWNEDRILTGKVLEEITGVNQKVEE